MRRKRTLHPIQILINYWETRPNAMGTRLDDLLRQGITHIATFVPWQAAEADIWHTLPRFLQAVADRRMTAALIVTPEVGVHYPNSGLPRDVVAKPENQAKHAPASGSSTGDVVVTGLPPNAFAAPSLFAPDFTKRYYSFLSRMDNLLADFEKSRGAISGVTVVLTGSYWKYYRTPKSASRSVFGGTAGDYCGNATLVYRQCLEEFYSRREFLDPTPMSATRWKSAAMEDVNRRWFSQQSEDVFRARGVQLIRRKSGRVPAEEIELYTPEADPAFLYTSFLETISGGLSDFRRLSSMIDEMTARSSQGAMDGAPLGPFIHWTSLGGFRTLCDPEKQFLILKSLLLTAGRAGGIFIDEREWFSLSASFRARAEAFAKSAVHGDFQLRNRALYLTPHLWSGPASGGGSGPAAGAPGASTNDRRPPLWEELRRKVGPRARTVASLELALRERDANLLIVDPSYVFTRECIVKLVAWTQSNRVVVLPRTPLFTESARRELEQLATRTKSLEIDLGMPYRLHAVGEGKLIVYDLPEKGDLRPAAQAFLAAVLSLAEVQGYCRLSDDRLMVIPVRRPANELGLFILNPTRRTLTADVIFPTEVEVSDLALAIQKSEPGVPTAATPTASGTVAARFSLDVPPCGILPLGVKGLDFATEERASPSQGPTGELPGYDGGEQAWS